MAEGGGEFGRDDSYLDHAIDNDGYDDDQEVNRTHSFDVPQQASTPHHAGEQLEMQTMQHEQSGMPSYEEETSFGGDETDTLIGGLKENSSTGILDITKGIPDVNFDFLEGLKEEQINRAKIFLKNRYPRFNEKDLVIGFSTKKPPMLVSKGPKGGETPIFLADGSDFRQHM